MSHKNIFYVTGTDVSVLSASEVSGYYYINPVDGSSDFYTNTASSMNYTSNTFQNYFSGYTLIVMNLFLKEVLS